MTTFASIPQTGGLLATEIRAALLRVLDALPPAKQTAVLEFARFLQVQGEEMDKTSVPAGPLQLRTMTVDSLTRLNGLLALGGDAVHDTETLYDDAAHRH